MVHGLSCSAACGIFPDQGSNPCPLHWDHGVLTTALPGKSQALLMFYAVNICSQFIFLRCTYIFLAIYCLIFCHGKIKLKKIREKSIPWTRYQTSLPSQVILKQIQDIISFHPHVFQYISLKTKKSFKNITIILLLPVCGVFI